MLKGVCGDPGPVTVLEKGASYFLFPAGPSHYYVSKFPRKDSHRGCFIKTLFDNLEDFTPETKEHSPEEEVHPKEQDFEQLSLF